MAPKNAKRGRASRQSAGATTRRRPRGKGVRLGGLKDMLEMPLDVLHEIFMYFLPQDLLSLSRTSKAFHDFLWCKSSACYWKQALERITGLPPCPKELIEPAWAAFVYWEPICTECDTMSEDIVVLWPFFMRLCGSCRPKLTLQMRDVDKLRDAHDIPNKVISKAKDRKDDPKWFLWLRSEVKEVVETSKRSEHFGPGSEKWEAFVSARLKQVKALNTFQNSCLDWVKKEKERQEAERWAREIEREAQKAERQAQEQRVCDERYTAIVSKLQEEGWGPEVNFLDHDHEKRLANHKLVKVARPLTDRSWRSVYSGLVKLMEEVREERLAFERVQGIERRWRMLWSFGPALIKAYLKGHPEMTCYRFNAADLALTPACKEIAYAPRDTDTSEPVFFGLQPKMHAIFKGWVSEKRKELREMLPSKAVFPKDVDPLQLATTIFACRVCSHAYLFFPDVFAHPCQRLTAQVQLPGNDLRPRRDSLNIDCRHIYSLGNPLRFLLREYEPTEAASQIVRLCNKDPRRTTVADMDACDVRLVQGGSIMTWRAAIIEQTQLNHDVSSWRVADQKETSEAKEAETKLLQSLPQREIQNNMYASGICKLKLETYEVMRVSTRSR